MKTVIKILCIIAKIILLVLGFIGSTVFGCALGWALIDLDDDTGIGDVIRKWFNDYPDRDFKVVRK